MTNERTVLYDQQVADGGKMIDFHGWDMPVQFSSITDEHSHVRQACGCFDLGHMGRIRLDDPAALAFLDARVTRPLASMKPGQVRYGLICNQTGGVEDDILVSRESDNSFHIVVNASNLNKILDLWKGAPGLVDLSNDQAMIAVQGPTSPEVLSALGLETESIAYYHFADQEWQGQTIRLSRTGYTGENGYEVFCPTDIAVAFWQAAVAAGARPCGLGCRDTLRLEAGMPLYGNELDTDHTPIEAGLAFAVGKTKSFVGSDVLQTQRTNGTTQQLVGLKISGKRPARSGYPVLKDGEAVGVVTSGSLSPTLGHAIAMAYIDSNIAETGTVISIDIRGRSTAEAEIIGLPFYRRG